MIMSDVVRCHSPVIAALRSVCVGGVKEQDDLSFFFSYILSIDHFNVIFINKRYRNIPIFIGFMIFLLYYSLPIIANVFKRINNKYCVEDNEEFLLF